MKIEQKPERPICHLEVGKHLRRVYFVQLSNRFALNDKPLTHGKVEDVGRQLLALVEHGHFDLTAVRYAGSTELYAESILVDTFKQAGSERCVHVKRESDDSVRKILRRGRQIGLCDDLS